MNKVNLISRVPPQYYSPAFTSILRDVEQSINQRADAYLFRIVSTAVNYTAHVGDSLILVTANNKTITLPAATMTKNKRYTVKNAGGSVTTTVVQGASGNIDGAANYTTTAAYEAADFISDGTNYWVI